MDLKTNVKFLSETLKKLAAKKKADFLTQTLHRKRTKEL